MIVHVRYCAFEILIRMMMVTMVVANSGSDVSMSFQLLRKMISLVLLFEIIKTITNNESFLIKK